MDIPVERGGFVLALVIMMLFAISVAGATGYLVVNTEFTMAKHSGQGAEAASVARAGLHRYVAEQLGVLGDSVTYAIGDGVALVTRRLVAQKDSITDVYYIRSEGTIVDIFAPATPARRVVGAYAVHHRRPIRHFAAVVVSAQAVYADQLTGVIDADDNSDDPNCPGVGAPPVGANIIGAIARTTTGETNGGTLHGHPNGRTWSGGFPAFYDSLDVRWDVLSDPTFPVDFEDAPPPWASLPADSFPVVRVNGDFVGSGSWSGRGVLIVTGLFDAGSWFSWRGIVLAGAVDDLVEPMIDGMFVAGFNGPNPYNTVSMRGEVWYYNCLVKAASESISYLELLENTVFEAS